MEAISKKRLLKASKVLSLALTFLSLCASVALGVVESKLKTPAIDEYKETTEFQQLIDEKVKEQEALVDAGAKTEKQAEKSINSFQSDASVIRQMQKSQNPETRDVADNITDYTCAKYLMFIPIGLGLASSAYTIRKDSEYSTDLEK